MDDLRFEDDMYQELQQCIKIREKIYNDVNKGNVGFTIDTSKHLQAVARIKQHNKVLKRFGTHLLMN